MARTLCLKSLVGVVLAFTLGSVGCTATEDKDTDSISQLSQASSSHFTKNGTPTCTDTGSLLVCEGELVGLGNEDLVLALTSSAEATFLCGAPGNENLAAGQNKVSFTASGSETIPGGAIKNGRATFTVSAPTNPPTATWDEAGCPNKNWHVVSTADIDFSKIILTITQGTLLFTCEYPGTVPEGGTVTLTCK